MRIKDKLNIRNSELLFCCFFIKLLYSIKRKNEVLQLILRREGTMNTFDHVFKPGSEADRAMKIPGSMLLRYPEKGTKVSIPIPGKGMFSMGFFPSAHLAAEKTFAYWRKEMRELRLRRKKEERRKKS